LVAAQGGGQSERPDLFEIRYRLGIAYRMAGQAQEAIRELEAVLQAQPTHAEAQAHLGSLYYQTRQYDRAWRHARRAETLGVPVAELIAALPPRIDGTPVTRVAEDRELQLSQFSLGKCRRGASAPVLNAPGNG
jgi:tetratricopeptide (TPR) repeat protein